MEKVKISTCIYELLLENETVIIPGFGAFISHYKPAEIHPETDEIKPPSKELSFTQQIRNNDGLLVGYVSGKEGISHFDALKEIEKERENIIYQLDKGEKITFENVGILYRNENGEIVFESFQQENLLLDSFGLESTSLAPLEPEIEEEEKEEQEESLTEIEPDIEDEKQEEQEKPVSEVETESMEPETEPEITSDKEIEEPHKTNDEPTIFIKEQLVFRETDPVEMPEEQKEKKKRGWLWFLLILVPIIVAGYFLYTKQNQTRVSPNVTENKPTTNNETVKTEEVPPADSVKKDTFETETTSTLQFQTKQTGQPSSIETASQGNNYYLVGGSFKEEENAEKFLKEFDVENYTPFKLGKRGNFYIIAIGRYNTEKEAVEAQNKFIEKKPDSGTWVYKDETR